MRVLSRMGLLAVAVGMMVSVGGTGEKLPLPELDWGVFDRLKRMTPIPGFVNQENLERARNYSWDPRFRDASVTDFQWSLLSAAAIRARFAKFH